MSDAQRQQLRKAYDLIKGGQKKEAGRILLDILKTDRDNADAWWLLANAATDPDKARQALGQVLRLRPSDQRALNMMARLDRTSPSARPSTPAFDLDDPFASDDPFGDPFAPPSGRARTTPSTSAFVTDDPFAEADERHRSPEPDPFGDPFSESSSRSRSSASDDPFGDPFAESPSSSRASASDDPFGDPFAESSRSRASVPDDPFGDPFAEPPSRSRAPVDDPFGDPFAPSSRGTSGVADPFGDPFAGPGAGAPPPPVREKKKGTNPIVIILAIIGAIAFCGCLAIVLLTVGGISIGGIALNQALQDPTVQAAFGELNQALQDPTFQAAIQEFATAMPSGTLAVGNLIDSVIDDQGTISPNEPVRGNLPAGSIRAHGYTFTGSAGARYTIEVRAVDNAFDTQLALLSSDNTIINYSDDIGDGDLNSRLEVVLPADGNYRIVVGAFGNDGGAYELSLLSK